VLKKFLKTWGERDKTRSEYSQTSIAKVSVVGPDPAGVTMLLSRRLMAVMKAKKIIHIEAGLEMIALALAICSEVRNIAMSEVL
jgi:type IV secretory pathway ATPase VirB11/archaellum biosynthesis ATPase